MQLEVVMFDRLRSCGAVGATTLAALALGSVMWLSAMTAPVSAQVSYRFMSCGQLWYARNAIYARRGYCFKTQRARRVFGRRCYAPYGRLRPWERRQVQRIQRWERRKGC
jgi:hypothetical protein